MATMLKRKNEEESSTIDQLNKRVALDSEQLEASEKKDEEAKTAPTIANDVDINFTENETSPIEQDDVQQPTEPINTEEESKSKPVSNHRESENDPTYVNFRMYCPVKEAALVVGKGGEIISHIKEKSSTRINVSENLRNSPERIISVRGPSENVAKAFGLIARTILNEPEDEPSSIASKQYILKVLLPHPIVGYIIGKSGAKFREIEENSASKLKAAEQELPFSTDRIISITGVADAIHIAVYYISLVFLEHKDELKKHKVVYYNPANAAGQQMLSMAMIPPNNMMIMGGINPLNLNFMGLQSTPSRFGNHNSTHSPGFAPMRPTYGAGYSPMPIQHHAPPPISHQLSHHHIPQDYSNNPALQMLQQQSAISSNQHIIGLTASSTTQLGGDKVQQDIFVPNENIGSVIGKGGKNIRQIRLAAGCSYIKIEEQEGHKHERKLTLTGTSQANQMAIYLINQKIEADKERNKF